MEIPERVVIDTKPLVAHADDEPGSETVAEYLDATAVEGTDGYVNRVNLTEIRYILARKYDRTVADEYIDWLLGFGLHPVSVDAIWTTAAEYVLDYNPALGDSFALSTAEHVEAALLVGADDDYDEITEVSIQWFCTEPV
jgi:predicted nucleic acid-binding protein